jgi:REP element-mobilizing transposase RayT
MSRRTRIDHHDARHHVMSRGARKQAIFQDDGDRRRFLEVLAHLPGRFGVRVHAFALMTNHYHLLLETPRANLSRAMQHLNSSYVRHLNDRLGWDGPLFRGRFNSVLVQSDAQWRYLLLYLHLNPVRGGLALDVDGARWTSHPYYTGAKPTPSWLETAELSTAFGSVHWYRRRLEQVRQGLAEPPDGLDPDALWTRGPVVSPPKQVVTPGPIGDALAEVEHACAVPQYRLTRRLPGKDQRARWLAAWWLQRRTGRTQREVSEVLGATTSQVCTWVKTVERRRFSDLTLAAWAQTLEDRAELHARQALASGE